MELNKIRNVLDLLRVRQYYKNILIFVGAFFSVSLLNISLILVLILGFIVLCCTSSINYIINDIRDIEKDKKHPEKLQKRPLASGDLSVSFAIVMILILIGIMLFIIIFLIPNVNFLIMVILIIITGQLYNLLLKNYAFIDVLALSLIYLWRALAGCLLINVFISPWLFLAIFEVAMFLVIAKRKGDLILLKDKEKAVEHKRSYDAYSIELLEQFHIIIAASLFITYSFYLIIHFNLFTQEGVDFHEYIAILTIPISLYILMRYMYLTSAKPEIARSTEKAFLDPGIIIASIILLSILSYSFYFEEFLELFNY
ncbi:MAG: UbiA prenyltransferase family protein [Promethearchaeota archaeon]